MGRGQDHPFERVYKSLWHVLIAGVGVYELRNHKTRLSKVLAVGLIAFHVDGAISDLTGSKPLSRRILESVTGSLDAEEEDVQCSPYERADRRTSRR